MDKFWKGKKIIAYVALLHHTRFIIPVMEKLERLGASVQYVVGQAERSQEITAVECHLNYRHVFDFLSNDDFDAIQKNYLRERKVFSKALTTDFAMATQMVTVMDKTLYSTAQEYVAFKNLLTLEKPDICFALHEVNRWGKMFAFRSKQMDIPFITLQEGLGYDPNFGYIGHVQYSTLDLVWGERIRKKFSDFEAPVERIIPVGNTHLSKEKKYQKKNNIRKKMRRKYDFNNHFVPLLIFSSKPVPKDILLPLFEVISNQPHLKLIIKFHPACKYKIYQEWKASIPDKLKKKLIFIHGHESTYDLISACDLTILARPSTTGLESIAFGKPLIQLKIPSKSEEPYSFVEQKVAIGMNPSDLAKALADKTDFKNMFDPKIINHFLKNELTDTDGATDRIITILQKAISANRTGELKPLYSSLKNKYKWSFVILVPANHPNDFLFQLNCVSKYSEDCGEFEVILVTPHNISSETTDILNSLEGNISILNLKKNQNKYDLLNDNIPETAKGENILFFSELVSPKKGWLSAVDTAFHKYGSQKIFGGKIENKYKNIFHAGIVLNSNNSPVSAYRHLDTEFPAARKERSFQILDHFIAVNRQFFLDLGGFWSKAGNYSFMDLCFRASEKYNDPDIAIFLPRLNFIKLEESPDLDLEDSIYFFSKWHGKLWESEESLYETDGISKLQLEAARMTRAMETAGK